MRESNSHSFFKSSLNQKVLNVASCCVDWNETCLSNKTLYVDFICGSSSVYLFSLTEFSCLS